MVHLLGLAAFGLPAPRFVRDAQPIRDERIPAADVRVPPCGHVRSMLVGEPLVQCFAHVGVGFGRRTDRQSTGLASRRFIDSRRVDGAD